MTDYGSTGAAKAASSAPEQRRHVRREIPLEVNFVLRDGTEAHGQIENISAGGALIRADADVQIGDRIIVRVHEVGHFPAVVTRLADKDMAVEFKIRRERAARIADMLICLVNGNKKPKENRLEVRAAGQFVSQLTLEDGQVLSCQVIDFSTSGASVAVEPMPRLGSKVRLGKTQAHVVHTNDGVIGLSFATLEQNEKN